MIAFKSVASFDQKCFDLALGGIKVAGDYGQ